MSSDLAFYVAAALSVLAALLAVTRRNPVYSAIFLIVCFIGVAGVFLHLAAPFVAAIQVIVYAGAIVVLFLFVVMLLNLRKEEYGREIGLRGKLLMACAAAAILALIAVPLLTMADVTPASPTEGYGGVKDIGVAMFDRFVLPFELVSVLIIAVIVGVIALAGKRPASRVEGQGEETK